jgi:hypothetical protein
MSQDDEKAIEAGIAAYQAERERGHLFQRLRAAMLAYEAAKSASAPVGFMRPEDNDGNAFWCHRSQNGYYSVPVYLAPSPEPAPSPAAVQGSGVDWKHLFEIAHGALICIGSMPGDWQDYARRSADDLTAASLSSAPTSGVEAGGQRPYGEVMDELDHAYRLEQETPEGGAISSAELVRRCGGDPDAPFVRGPFPPEMREPSPYLAKPAPEPAGDVREALKRLVDKVHEFGTFKIDGEDDPIAAFDDIVVPALVAGRAALSAPASPKAAPGSGVPLWRYAPWEDGSSADGEAMIFCDGWETAVAGPLDIATARMIVDAHNDALAASPAPPETREADIRADERDSAEAMARVLCAADSHDPDEISLGVPGWRHYEHLANAALGKRAEVAGDLGVEDASRYVEEMRESIRKGARTAPKRFRL